MMIHEDFSVGHLFSTAQGKFMCLDKGNRCIIALRQEAKKVIGINEHRQKEVRIMSWNDACKDPTAFEPIVFWDYEYSSCYKIGQHTSQILEH